MVTTLSTHAGRSRAVIENVEPEIEGGRYSVKRSLGDRLRVEADVFTDGHDAVAARLLWRKLGAENWQETPMQLGANDRWRGEFTVDSIGVFEYTVDGWVDAFQTWHRDLLKRIDVFQDSHVDYAIGAGIIEQAISQAPQTIAAPDRHWMLQIAALLRGEGVIEEKRKEARRATLVELLHTYPNRELQSRYSNQLRVTVDPVRARFSSWYEFFPRSSSAEAGRHGTFKDCLEWLPYVAEMGFDVLYFPPIHPIGISFRKGKNNSVNAEPGDVGSCWAIGGAEGGHVSIHPRLGTLDDFVNLVHRARDLNIDIALDIAFQVSPDHPYVKDHPEWFRARPDGTIQYAENPPKKYQDIYPFDFESSDWMSMWEELKNVFIFWLQHGVRIFRVDNPHTKAFGFWEWAIAEVKRDYPEALFLSEAFTRPKVMYRLAKVGFSQSYTYFPWRHTKRELTAYMTELTQTKVVEFFRANHWPNTPDILTEFLQTHGRAGFVQRLLLAATLGANYGIYGPAFELCESASRHPGSEEYLDSEKYQIRHWDRDRPGSLKSLISRINRIRHENEALQNDSSLRFLEIDNESLLAFSKQSPDGSNLVVVVINLDTRYKHSGYLELPLETFKLEGDRTYQAHDLLSGARFLWTGVRNYVELDPTSLPAHIFQIRRRVRTEHEFEYFL